MEIKSKAKGGAKMARLPNGTQVVIQIGKDKGQSGCIVDYIKPYYFIKCPETGSCLGYSHSEFIVEEGQRWV